MMLNEEEFYDAVETALDQHDEEDGANDDLVTIKLNFTWLLSGADLASSARRGAGFPWCTREPYCPLSSAVCNATTMSTIPTLPLFEMAESACSPFCYVLHYLLFIKFISAFYHVCVTGSLL
jgi:hypothetical protein